MAMEIDIQHFLTKATKQLDCEALQAAYHLIKDVTPCINPELYVVCAEAALDLHCLEISTMCLKKYFEGNPQANQFLCRACLCQGRLKTPPATGNVVDFEDAIEFFLKAIQNAKDDPRYHFMVFNASVLYFQTVRPLLQPGRCLHLVPSLRQVVQSLEEIANKDHSWRAELMLHLLQCFADSGKKGDAADLAKVTEEFIKSHTPHLYSRLFMLQVKHDLINGHTVDISIKKNTTLAVMYKIHEFTKLGKTNDGKLTKEDYAKLEDIFYLLVGCAETSTVPVSHGSFSIQPADRLPLLLELALLSLQVKHQKIAANCLKELKLSGEASSRQNIIIKCVKSELSLLKKECYPKASVDARLKEIGKLDLLLQTAVKEGDPQAVQAVCATQWKFCLPLLQHTLRKRIKTPLLRVAQGLENIQSLLMEMRCQIHHELAGIIEEEGYLEDSLTHLQKAILLDNGTRHAQLSSALKHLRLRGTPYQALSKAEDKAAMLLLKARNTQPHKTDIRPTLLAIGLLLGHDDFQTLLDGDNIAKIPVESLGSGPVAQLSAKAQHHITSLQIVEGHLAKQASDTDHMERMKLWVGLVKTARKHEVWDVCRAACRFCLLYDDGRWKISKANECTCSVNKCCAECLHDFRNRSVRDCLRLLAEIYFISAEATIQKLLTEGLQLNSPAVPPHEPVVDLSENADWVIYKDWVQDLSDNASSNFLRAAELGLEIMEPWVVANTAIYLWNYSSNLLVGGEYLRLLPSFQSLVEMLRKVEYTGNQALVVLLCNAVAQGLIKSVCGPNSVESTLPAKEGKNVSVKKKNTAAMQDIHRALELCDHALQLSSCNIPGDIFPIAAKKQLVATWVQIKLLLQQRIDLKNIFKDECTNEEVLVKVLIGVEMHECNRTRRPTELAAPSLSTLVTMASECSWMDAMVELQVWCQLAALCHPAKDHGLVLCCTEKALLLQETAAKHIKTLPCVLYDLTAVNGMLSSAACLRGLSLVHESKGDLQTYRKAMKVLLSSINYAEKTNNPKLCVTAARHYWNTCLPLTWSPKERWKLKDSLEKILNALVHITSKHEQTQVKVKGTLTLTGLYFGSSKREATDEEDLTLRAAVYSLLLYIHIEKLDRKGALQLLDKAIGNTPSTRHTLFLLKHCIILKARLGGSVLMDILKIRDTEQRCSLMWHQVALCARDITQQLTYYQKSITSLLSPDSQWQKVDLILKFGEWLYCHNFPKASAQHHLQWAIDILLHLDTEQAEGEEKEEVSKKRSLRTQEHISLVGVQSLLFRQNLSSLKEVCRLDYLVRAHTLLAVMAGRGSPEHRLNLLRAYAFVLQIWQVSMEMICELLKPPPSTGSKKGKDKDKGKNKKKAKTVKISKPLSDESLPSFPADWVFYTCPDEVREIFKSNSHPHCINTNSILNQTQSIFYLNLLEKELLSISLDHITLPVLHLAETIASDLLDRSSLSDLYRIKILRTCSQLGLETHSPYQEILQDLCRTSEQEQIECHTLIAISKDRGVSYKTEWDINPWPGQQRMNVCAQDIWLDNAEVCLSMGHYQPARQLLAEAHLVARELGDQKAVARSLLSLATLACEEQNHAQALILLDKAQDLSGDEEFWYQLTLTKVRAIVGQRQKDAQTKVDQIIAQGCVALKLVMEQQVNRVPEITFLITSLEMRGAMENIGATDSKPGMTLCHENVQSLMAACDTLRDCVNSFIKFNYRQQAAEACMEYAHGMRLLANNATKKEEKHHFLLDGLTQMQQAVTLQEYVVLNAQVLLPTQGEPEISLTAAWRLLRMRLALAEFGLTMLEELCADETYQALSHQRKTSIEIAMEEFMQGTLEPSSREREWMTVGSTLGQVALGQLGAVSCHSLDSIENRARCLTLMGKYLRLQAVRADPLYVRYLWDKYKQHEAFSDLSVQPQKSDSGKDRESTRKEQALTTAKIADLKRRRHKAEQLVAQATNALTEAISLCLQHNLPSSILADASINIMGCCGQSGPAMTGQYLALFQSCCTVSMVAEVLRSACVDTGVSQLTALHSLHRKLLHSQGERPSSMVKGLENSLNSLSKAFSQLTINSNHLNILEELPPNLKILLLQHSEDGSELYGAFYEMSKVPETKGKTTQATGTLTCSNVAKVQVCPQDLLTLREQIQAFGHKTSHALLKEVCLYCAEGNLEASEEHHKITTDEWLAPDFCKIVRDMENYLKPLLTQFDFSCLRTQVAEEPCIELKKPKGNNKNPNIVKPQTDTGQNVVLLADGKLLDLPLESLLFLREEGLSSVSRDFSLQLLYSRLNKETPESAQGNNEKETKGGKGTKKKKKQTPAGEVQPDYPQKTFSADTRNLKCIADSYDDGSFRTSFSTKIIEVLETHSKHSRHQWESILASLSQLEQLLSKCSAFIYLGREHFITNISPAKLAGLNLSKCRMALVFEQVHNDASSLRQSIHDEHGSEGLSDLQKHQETALLLSLAGVGCVVVNQQQSSFQQTTNNMVTVLDKLVRVKQTSGETIHTLRRTNGSEMAPHKIIGSYDPVNPSVLKEGDAPYPIAVTPSAFNCILYGLPNISFT